MVSEETKEVISETVNEFFAKMNRIAWIDRQKQIKTETFRNTEKLLYCYKTLKAHIAEEDAYIAMAFKKKSGSVIKYSKNRTMVAEDQILRDRMDSYNRSKSDIERVEKALEKVKERKGFPILQMRYLDRKNENEDELYTYDEIAEKLAGKYGFPETLHRMTVIRHKDKLIREIAILLFGSDAI